MVLSLLTNIPKVYLFFVQVFQVYIDKHDMPNIIHKCTACNHYNILEFDTNAYILNFMLSNSTVIIENVNVNTSTIYYENYPELLSDIRIENSIINTIICHIVTPKFEIINCEISHLTYKNRNEQFTKNIYGGSIVAIPHIERYNVYDHRKPTDPFYFTELDCYCIDYNYIIEYINIINSKIRFLCAHDAILNIENSDIKILPRYRLFM